MKDLSTCVLAIALVASVCVLHEDSWSEDCELVTLGSLDPRRLCGRGFGRRLQGHRYLGASN